MKFKLELSLSQVCLLQMALESRVEEMQKHVDSCKKMELSDVLKEWEKRRDNAKELLAVCNTTRGELQFFGKNIDTE